MISFSESPTAEFLNLKTLEKVRGAVGSLILKGFKRLNREEKQ